MSQPYRPRRPFAGIAFIVQPSRSGSSRFPFSIWLTCRVLISAAVEASLITYAKNASDLAVKPAAGRGVYAVHPVGGQLCLRLLVPSLKSCVPHNLTEFCPYRPRTRLYADTSRASRVLSSGVRFTASRLWDIISLPLVFSVFCAAYWCFFKTFLVFSTLCRFLNFKL
jgi:hypothetical protein